MYVCMYVCAYMHACMYACMHVCVDTHMHTNSELSQGGELPSACVADQEKEPTKFETFWTSYGKYFKACQYVPPRGRRTQPQ